MHLRLSNPASVPELRQHFERSGFATTLLSRDAIELHLDVWRAMHPDVEVEVRPRTS
jgi:hypothetical protein